jgi:uncharacterized delta-60 repeat protein
MRFQKSVSRVVRSLGKTSAIALCVSLVSFFLSSLAFAGNKFAIAGYQPNGSLDASLDGDGKVATDFSANGDAAAKGMVVDSSNRIVVVGTADNQFALVRYLPSGSPDSSFGVGGKVLTSFAGFSAAANAVALDQNGKVVVVGEADGYFGVARYNPDGNLDTSFGNIYAQGKVKVSFPSCGSSEAHAVAVDSSNRIVVAGTTFCSGYTGSAWALARLSSNGLLDSSFGSSGKVITSFASDDGLGEFDKEVAGAIAVDSSGKIVVGGHAYWGAYENGYTALVVARYSTTGNLDSSFARDGSGSVGIFPDVRSWDEQNETNALAIDANGRIVIAGKVYSGVGHHFALARLTSNGVLDPSFGEAGEVLTSFGWVSSEAHAIKITSAGKILTAGAAGYNSSLSVFALARYNSNGTLDTSFDGDGRVTTDFTCQGPEAARAIAFQSWGFPIFYTRTLVAGWASGAPCP